MINVLLVEDSKITRDMLESKIARSLDYAVTASLENAANAQIICAKRRIDLILMDVCTADDESGLEASARIKKHHPDIRIIIMTSMPEYSFMQKAKAAGCDSFWYKEYGDTELLDVMNRTMRGESVYPDVTPPVSIGNAGSAEFMDRELDVLRQLTLGYGREKIAENLDIKLSTVKYHIKNLLEKTGYESVTQLVVAVVDKRFVWPKR